MAHLAKRAKIHNNSQNNQPPVSKDNSSPQIGWSRKTETEAKPKNEIHMIRSVNMNAEKSRVLAPSITFSKDDPIPEHFTGDNPFITADVGTTYIHIIYVDGGSFTVNHVRTLLRTADTRREKGNTTSDGPTYRKTIIDEFVIRRVPSPYNIILGRPRMMKLRAVSSTLHVLLKFETQKGIVVRGERFQLHDCSQVSRKRDHPEEASDTEGVDRIIVNNAFLEQTLDTSNLPKTLKEKLHEFLCQNKDIFAWKPTDMTGILRKIT
ncbi:hypothetical protein Tco_1448473 [Tanacetum coccineum]